MKLQIMRLRPEAILPERQTPGSAGYDLSACLTEDLVIEPGDCVPVSTGIALCPDRQDVVLLVYARSGLATKHGVSMANGVGVIDSDYRGELHDHTGYADRSACGNAGAAAPDRRSTAAAGFRTGCRRIRLYWSIGGRNEK